MKTFTVEMNEEQMMLIRASLSKVLLDEYKNPGSLNLSEDEIEELELLSDMFLETVEEGDVETVHGFCY
jgi:hypothetical protein